MNEVEAQHEIEKLQGILSFTEDERKGLALDKKQLTKELSEAQLYIKRLEHEKEILLAELEAEIKKELNFNRNYFSLKKIPKTFHFEALDAFRRFRIFSGIAFFLLYYLLPNISGVATPRDLLA